MIRNQHWWVIKSIIGDSFWVCHAILGPPSPGRLICSMYIMSHVEGKVVSSVLEALATFEQREHQNTRRLYCHVSLRAGPGLHLVLTLFYQRCFIRVQQQLLTTEQTSPCLARMFLRQILLSSNALVVTVTTVQGKLFLNICHFLRFLLWKTDPSDHFKTLSNHYQWCLYNTKLGKAKIYNSKNSYSNKIVKFNLKTRSEPRVNNYRQLAKDIKLPWGVSGYCV